ncbi:MAG: hypothetical protein AAFV53_42840 [Myxococcota bacterium]
MHWVEICWLDEQWAWRALSRAGDTVGVGQYLNPEWRRLDRGNRISLRGSVGVELTSDAPPTPYAIDLQSGDVLEGSPLEGVLAQHRDTNGPFEDGVVLIDGTRPLRLHLPEKALLQPERISLQDPNTTLKIFRRPPQGHLGADSGLIPIEGELARILIPYVEARLAEPNAGWLTRKEAYTRWLEAGGNPESRSHRLGWMRGRLRTRLARQGVAETRSLFENRRSGSWYGTRIGLDAEQLLLV